MTKYLTGTAVTEAQPKVFGASQNSKNKTLNASFAKKGVGKLIINQH